jgi:isopentenyl diphosphate isomerase/L-lactate dehydrogenase-like FMN-dependent dehydrogenase
MSLVPSTLVTGTRDLSIELFGVRQALPMVIATGGWMLHHRADYELAAAAARRAFRSR